MNLSKLVLVPLSFFMIAISGCAGTIGVIEPVEMTGVRGETIVACKIKGVSFAFGDGGTCATVEGGEISQAGRGVIADLTNTIRAIIGGFFTGLGGIGSAVSASGSGEATE